MKQKNCSFPGCPRPYRAKGMCDTHYRVEKRRLEKLEQEENNPDLCEEVRVPLPTPDEVAKAWRMRLRPKG